MAICGSGVIKGTPEYFILDWVGGMVTQLIYYRVSIFFARFVRLVVTFASFIQRLPVVVVAGVVFGIAWLCYRLFGWHRWYIRVVKLLFRGMFFLRGVHCEFKLPSGRELSLIQGINICNHGSNIYWLLFAYLPYDHLIIAYDQFFSTKMFRSMVFSFGFVPQEYGITPENIRSFDSRLSDYLDQSFAFWQPFFFEYRDTESLPYLLMLGIKFNRGVNIWSVKRLDQLSGVSWLRRVRVSIELVQQLPIARRVPVTIAAYEQCLVQNFGAPEAEKYAARNRPPGMPPSNTDLAKEKIAIAKKKQAELENEALGQ